MTDAQPRSPLSTFLLVNDAQRAGIPDEQMPVAEHAEGASVHAGEVEEVVEVVGGHGAQHGQELQGQVCGHLGGRAEEVAQGPGAGADHQAPTGAQVPWEGPALHVREDLWGRAGMGDYSLPSLQSALAGSKHPDCVLDSKPKSLETKRVSSCNPSSPHPPLAAGKGTYYPILVELGLFLFSFFFLIYGPFL